GEQARKVPETAQGESRVKIRRIGIIGAGTMGSGIAQLAALRGYSVLVREPNQALVKAGSDRIAALFAKAVERGIASEEESRQKLAMIDFTTSLDKFGEADLVIEAAAERLCG